jgi:hypothetical protein
MDVLRKRPRVINAKRLARNGTVPDANFTREVIAGQNHITQFCRKVLFRSGTTFTNGDTHGSFMNTMRWRSHIGYGATRVKFLVMFGQDVADTASDPRINIAMTEVGIGSTAATLRIGHIMDSGAAGVYNSPSLSPYRIISMDVTPNATYEFVITRLDSARPLSVLAWEESDPDFSVDYYHELQPGVESPIRDSTRQRILQGLSNTYRRNGTQLVAWCDSDTSLASVFTSATWANVLNPLLSTATPTSPGFFLGDEDFRLDKQCRISSGKTLNVVLAAYGSMSAGSTGEVRFQDENGTLCSVTGISTVAQWYTSTTTISNCDRVGKADLQARTSNAANTLTLNAVSLYTYLA